MADEKNGIKTAVNELVGSGEMTVLPPEPDVEQMNLFDQMDSARKDPHSFGKALRKAAGRPKGARNRATLANKEYCLRRGYACALDLIAFEASQDPLEIRQRFGCSIEAAMAWVRSFREQYADFTEKRMPRAVEFDGDTAPVFQVVNFSTEAAQINQLIDARTEGDVKTVEMADFREKSEDGKEGV
jgi:hypothetical protein